MTSEQFNNLQAVLSGLGDAVIATDPDGRITGMNALAEALTGWARADAAGQPLDVVFRTVHEHSPQRADALATAVLIARDGSLRPIDLRAAPLPDGRLLAFRDAAERRRAEEDRLRLAAIVESCDDAIIGKTLDGGTVTAHSDGPGTGSEFTVRLPAVRPVAAPAADSNGDRMASAARRRILVVDDNRDAAGSLALLLRLEGNEVCTAEDGLTAIETASSFRPDVILLDIGMPRLNGHDAARRIRQQPWGRDVVLIALTGWGQEADRQRSHEAGFDHHLVKPVDLAALQALLRARG